MQYRQPWPINTYVLLQVFLICQSLSFDMTRWRRPLLLDVKCLMCYMRVIAGKCLKQYMCTVHAGFTIVTVYYETTKS